jgi:hypothetical protein
MVLPKAFADTAVLPAAEGVMGIAPKDPVVSAVIVTMAEVPPTFVAVTAEPPMVVPRAVSEAALFKADTKDVAAKMFVLAFRSESNWNREGSAAAAAVNVTPAIETVLPLTTALAVIVPVAAFSTQEHATPPRVRAATPATGVAAVTVPVAVFSTAV